MEYFNILPAYLLVDMRDIKGGVQRVIAGAMVKFQLSAPDIANRAEALDSIARRPEVDQLVPLLASITDKPDPTLRTRKEVLASRLTATFGNTLKAVRPCRKSCQRRRA